MSVPWESLVAHVRATGRILYQAPLDVRPVSADARVLPDGRIELHLYATYETGHGRETEVLTRYAWDGQDTPGNHASRLRLP